MYVKTMSAHGSHLGCRLWSPDTILKVYYPRTIDDTPNFTALFIQFKVIAFSLFFSVVQGPIIVKMGLICHWANSKSCFTGTFHVFVIVAFLYICSTTYIYCLYKGEDVLSCKTCI